MAVSIQQAACNALGAHLQAKLSGVVVNYDFPDPDRELPELALTILLAGTPHDTSMQPEVISSTVVDATHKLYRWKVLERSQPIQVDVWSTYQALRDDLVARLDQIFNGGWSDQPDSGLTLSLGDGWDAKAVFDFDGPSIINSGYSSQVSEFRGSYNGALRVALYVDAASPRMANIKLHSILNGNALDSSLT